MRDTFFFTLYFICTNSIFVNFLSSTVNQCSTFSFGYISAIMPHEILILHCCLDLLFVGMKNDHDMKACLRYDLILDTI